ncbi:hypothetical protein JHK87_012592 [Glycine soja]|nr:hypothetical protein JHK87_012592 [Glycine soja]
MKVEAEKCLTQTERIANERLEFESEIYAKDQLEAQDSNRSKRVTGRSAQYGDYV